MVTDAGEMYEVLSSMDYSEPWFVALMTTQAALSVTVIATLKHSNVQAAFFFTFLLLVYFSENINELAASRWRQQYFDSKGMFMSLFFSLPLLLNCLLIVGYWVWTSGNLMVKLKQAELRKALANDGRRAVAADKQSSGNGRESRKSK